MGPVLDFCFSVPVWFVVVALAEFFLVGYFVMRDTGRAMAEDERRHRQVLEAIRRGEASVWWPGRHA